MKNNQIKFIIAVFLVVMAATARVVNANMGLNNFVPIASISLFSGMMLNDKRAWALLIPILGQFAADLYFQLFTYVPGFYWAIDQVFTYGAIAAAATIGIFIKNPKVTSTAFAVLGASLTFFIVSNLGYFLHGWNGYTLQGLEKTYIDAIPFYRNSFIADMVGGIVLFGGYALLQRNVLARTSKAVA